MASRWLAAAPARQTSEPRVVIVRQLRYRPEAERTQVIRFELRLSTQMPTYSELVDLHAMISGGADLEPPVEVPMPVTELEAITQQPLATDIASYAQSTERR